MALSKGNRKALQCRYHGWTYGLDGSLRTCPEMEGTAGFDQADFGLVPIRVDRWGPFVFANLEHRLLDQTGFTTVPQATVDVINARLRAVAYPGSQIVTGVYENPVHTLMGLSKVDHRFDGGALVVETAKPDVFYARLTDMAASGEAGRIDEVVSPDDTLQAVFSYLVKP